MNTHTIQYQSAAQRIADNPTLEPYRTTILYDWPEGNEHLDWVASAPVDEILDWAQTIEGDSAYMIITPSPSEIADNADRQAESDYSHSDGAHSPDD